MRYPRMKFIFQQALVLWQSESREIVKTRQGGGRGSSVRPIGVLLCIEARTSFVLILFVNKESSRYKIRALAAPGAS
jgi:hypothetical protein